MKVKELIELLKEEDQELEIWLSRDSEGNSYSKLSQYNPYTSYIEKTDGCRTNEIFYDEWFEGYTEEELNEARQGMEKVLILFPI